MTARRKTSRRPCPLGVDRLDRIYQALTLLAERETTANRSERLLNLFSDLP